MLAIRVPTYKCFDHAVSPPLSLATLGETTVEPQTGHFIGIFRGIRGPSSGGSKGYHPIYRRIH
ncbi:MAG: hypothetical protein ACTSU2_17720 [Promethearchaeota archaeon]